MRLCVDLCSGKGGFSQSFKEHLDWNIITVDIERKFKPTIIADVCYLPLRDNLEPSVLLASPPCQRFSVACPEWPKVGIMKAMMMVGACFEAVARLKPKRWLIENPRGRLRWFIGKPRQTIRYSDYDFKYKVNKVTDFWGNIPFPMVKAERKIKVGHVEKGWFRRGFNYDLPRDRSRRSIIPKGVSEAVYEGVKNAELH